MMPTNLEESSVLDLKYPERVEVSVKSILGTRVTEPILNGALPNTESRTRVIKSKIKFNVMTNGPFGVTESGGIIFVTNRSLLKSNIYRYVTDTASLTQH